MKTPLPSKKKAPTVKADVVRRGRKSQLVNPIRFNFFIEPTLLEAMKDLDHRARKLGIKSYTGGYIARQGIALFIKQELAALKAAKSGNLHAKRR